MATDPFVGEITVFPYNFAPTGWAVCDGQLLPISQNTALFSLLGTTYGGDGRSTFGLPDLRGRAPMHPGQGPGLSLHDLGETGGAPTVTLLESEIPNHTHTLQATSMPAMDSSPAGALLASGPDAYRPRAQADALASRQSLTLSGSGLPHENMQPFLTFTFCIALQGIYPPRP